MITCSMGRKGRASFDAHYSEVYGERWEGLKQALQLPTIKVARTNAFADRAQIESRACSLEKLSFGGFETFSLQGQSATQKFEPETDASGLLDFYLLDPASILAAALCEVQEGDDVLDLCAAPGGKSLMLAERIGESGALTCNELSPQRRARLRAVLEDYIPESLRGRVKVTGHDGSRWCLHETEAFDRILLDAPCSGERHLLVNAEEMALWSPARSKNLAVRQYALLASALAVVRRGGRIVYSTCSISPLENDAVIARLLKKREGEARVIRPELRGFDFVEKSEFGYVILPDRSGYGPFYAAVIERV